MPVTSLLLAFAVQTAMADSAAEARHAKVVVIGADAVSLNILGPYMQSGVTPNLAELAASGSRGDLASIWPLRTPQVWTTIVTGKYPGQHGIWDHYTNTRYNPPSFRTKERRRLTTRDRKSKALWNLVDAAGLEVLSVGWIASWPAEKLRHGTIAAPAVLLDSKRQVSIKGSFWRDVPKQIEPASLWPEIQPLIIEADDLRASDLAAFADVPQPGHAIYRLPKMTRYVNALRWSIARAKSVEALTLHLAARGDPDVVMAYFQCADSLLHRFWIFQKPVEEIEERLRTHGIPTDLAPELRRRFGGVVEACYRDVDARVGRILEAVRGPETLVLFVSDHGFGEAPFPHPKKEEPYGGNHRDDGVIIAAGPGIAANGRISGASVLDITPTLLGVLDLPVAGDMAGKAIREIVGEERLQVAAKTVPSYERRPQTKIPYKRGWPSRRLRPLAVDR
jgi:predicted AlkP superfamily phosphohydrolase/phosphomutase